MLDNVRSAFDSVWSNKVRSLLTVVGVVIGVTSVTTLVAMGQGLKNDVSGLIEGFGTNVIVLIGGKLPSGGTAGLSAGANANPASFISGDVITQKDVDTVRALPSVDQVAPVTLANGVLKYGASASSSAVFGTTPNFLDAIQLLSLDKGRMIAGNAGQEIVLGTQARQELFGDADPLGKTVMLGNEPLTVIGYLGKSKGGSVFGSETDSISIIPFDEATKLNKDQVKIYRVIIKAADGSDVAGVKGKIHDAILANHGGTEDFSVLTQDDILGLFNQFLSLATAMISAIAAISLVVGGIGIMNIMLVTVTERTREIGLRKAVGATSRAIAAQFLTEAVIVTLLGGLLGLGLSLAIGKVVELKTPLHPAFTWEVVVLALGISVVIGVIFGLWPALRAARKDPIEALRYE